jgi:hypothetical protein
MKQQWNPQIQGEFYQYGGYTCSLSKGTVGYTLGYENAPLLFVQSHVVRERATLNENCFTLEAEETVEFYIDLYEFDATSELDINGVIKEVYYRYHQAPRSVSSIQTAVTDLAAAVSEDAWLPEDRCYSGFVYDDEDGSYRKNKLISIAWTNGMAVATPMLMAALRLKNEKMRQQALSCMTNIMENSLNSASGLPYEFFDQGGWSNKGWWYDGMHVPGHSSYLIGQAMYLILKAYEYEKIYANCIHGEWLQFVIEVLEKIEKTKNTDYEYPFILSSKTGAGIEYDALSGSWCMAALAYYSFLTGDRTYIEGMKKSESYY